MTAKIRTLAGNPLHVGTDEETESLPTDGTIQESYGGAWLYDPWNEEKAATPSRLACARLAAEVAEMLGYGIVFHTSEDRLDDLVFFGYVR